jgi:fibrillarin-like pre-rRNA processing protein
MGEIFENVFLDEKSKKLYTKYENSYREWDPYRSKLAAAIIKGLKIMPIKQGSKILYLGASTGTTCSHISDIIGKNGIVYGIEFSERVIYQFLELAEKRKNIVPILADARKPEEYYWVEIVDVVYCDLAQPDEIEIAIRNSNIFLKKNGYLMIAIKARSIDVTKEPKEIFEESKEKLKNSGFEIKEVIILEPYEEGHAMVISQKIS